jgi:hypothetical protein
MSSEEPGNGGDAQPDPGGTGMPEATPPPPAASTPPPPPPPPPSVPTPSPAGAPSGASSFDLSSVPTAVWISAGGALVLLISVFLNWYTASGSVRVGNVTVGGSASESGWNSGSLAKLVALLALVALAVWVIERFVPTVTLPTPAAMIAGGAGAVSILFVLIKILDKPSSGTSGISVGTSFGIWLALVSAIAVVVGAYMRMNETKS